MLPYRVRELLGDWRVTRYLRRAMDALAPLQVASDNLAAEVHMMVGKRHLNRAIAALYTFFFYSGLSDRVGLMFHLDGTVRPPQRRWLEKYIRGAAFSDYPSDDERLRDNFRDRPYCRQYYERGVSCMPKIFHPAVFARTRRVIVMDSDVFFFGRPGQIVDWVNDPDSPARYQVASAGTPVTPLVRRKFEELRPTSGYFEIKHYRFCSGLMMFSVDRFSFDVVENYLRWHATSGVPQTSDMYWFRPWTAEMTAYMLNFARWADAVPMDAVYAVGDKPSPVSNHLSFWGWCSKSNLLRIRRALLDVASPDTFAAAISDGLDPDSHGCK
jgi:hypothetical protein